MVPNKLQKIIESFSAPMTREEMYQRIVEEIVATTEALYGSILLYQNSQWKRVYSTAPYAYKTSERKKGNTYKAFHEQKIHVSHIPEMRKAHPELVDFGIQSSVFIPLLYQKESVGILIVSFLKKTILTKEEEETLFFFGTVAGTNIKRVQYYEERYDALSLRDQFLSIISHEIRNPLTTIHGYLELSKKKIEKKEEIKKEWLDISLHHTDQIVTKIKDLISANDITSGNHLTFSFNEIDLQDLLTKMIKIFFARFPHRELILKTPLNHSMKIIGDLPKLEYVFQNLLENSVKFSPAETVITLQIKEDQKQYIITITDEGRGISKEEMQKILKGFYKALQDSRQGMGVGIYLSDYIIKTHHGNLKITSKVNAGTKVTVSLPKNSI